MYGLLTFSVCSCFLWGPCSWPKWKWPSSYPWCWRRPPADAPSSSHTPFRAGQEVERKGKGEGDGEGEGGRKVGMKMKKLRGKEERRRRRGKAEGWKNKRRGGGENKTFMLFLLATMSNAMYLGTPKKIVGCASCSVCAREPCDGV